MEGKRLKANDQKIHLENNLNALQKSQIFWKNSQKPLKHI